MHMDYGHMPDKNCRAEMCCDCTGIFYQCLPQSKLFTIDGKKYCNDCAFNLYHPITGIYDRFTGKKKGDK